MLENHHMPEVRFFSRARHDNASCGDQAEYWIVDDTVILCLVDGLGHGEFAKEAARVALSFVDENLSMPLPELFHNCDQAIRHTRGVAMAIAIVNRSENIVSFAGIGNIHGAIVGKENIRLTSNSGIVGGGYRDLAPEIIPLSSNGLLGLFTDGIQESVDMTNASISAQPDLAVMANDIYETWGLKSDDSGILIYRNG